MNQSDERITTDECAREVHLMARRTALLHYFFSEKIIERLGEEEGKKLIKEAVWAYGTYCGKQVKKGVEELGLPLTDENFDKIPDLPKYGWEVENLTLENGEVRPISRFCPIAAGFMEFGERGRELGRIYCYVDQSKYEAYNPDMEFIHTRNILDKDPYCEFLLQPRADKKDLDS